MPDWTPEQIKRALEGDKRLARLLVDALTPLIQAKAAHALLRRGKANRQHIEDLVQSVLERLFANRGRKLRMWDPARGTLSAFVRVVAEHEIVALLRVSRPEVQAPDEPPEDPPARVSGPDDIALLRQLAVTIIARMREKLSELGRQMLDLLVLDERSADEVAAIMDMTVDAVFTWRSRLAKLARQVLAEVEAEPSR